MSILAACPQIWSESSIPVTIFLQIMDRRSLKLVFLPVSLGATLLQNYQSFIRSKL
jgi:hypothetical protein